MKRICLISTIAYALFIVGCAGNDPKVSTKGNHQHEETDVAHLETEEHKAGLIHLADELKLNNGEKWLANVETNEGIDNMLALVKKEESKETPAYVALKESLNKEFNGVLKKCTMSGESHDQLHHYLLPLKAGFEGLDASSNKETIEDIKNYLLSYYNYFK